MLQVDMSTQKVAPSKQTTSTKVETTSVAPIKMVQNTAVPIDKINKTVPKEIDKQLQIIYKSGIADLDDLPFWLKILGGNKAKKDFIKIVENKEFQAEMNEIFQKAKDKTNNPNIDVIGLMKDKDVFNKAFDCIKNHSQKGTLLNAILGLKIVKDKFSKNIENNQHGYLLYGE